MLQDRKNFSGPRLWGTTLGSPLVLRTRAETWVFPHNPWPLVFFLSHNPHFSSLCSLRCLKPKVLPKGILFSACDWKAVNCVCDTLGVTRLRLVTPWVYPIHHSFLGVYLSLNPNVLYTQGYLARVLCQAFLGL